MLLPLIRLSARRQFTYRAAALAGLATNFFFGMLRAAVMVALYGQRQEMGGITLQDAITFTGLSQASIAYISLFGWWDLMRTVYTGQVATDLLKPMDFFKFWMAQDAGRALVSLLTRGVIIMAFYALVFDISYPRLPGQWLGLGMAILLAWWLSFAWRFLVNLSAFWVPNAVGIGRMLYALSWIMSGFMMPLRFYPDWFQTLCYLTPFPQLVNTPVEIYLGVLNGTQLLQALLFQVFWIGILIALSRFVLQLGVRRLVIQGG